jgi:hypothetical protein
MAHQDEGPDGPLESLDDHVLPNIVLVVLSPVSLVSNGMPVTKGSICSVLLSNLFLNSLDFPCAS